MPIISDKPKAPPPITTHKAHWLKLNQKYARLFEDAGYDSVAKKLKDCETTELLLCCNNCGHKFWTVNHCRQRVCVLCAFKVARERAEYLQRMTADMSHPKLLTLTMPRWKTNPRDGVVKLRQAFAKLRRHIVFRNVRGGAYLLELVPKNDGWHIHLHALLDSPYLPYQKIFTAWKKLIDFPCPQVDIRSAHDTPARAYLAKDASKTPVFYVTPERIVDWYIATKGLRLFATFGKWFGKHTIRRLDPNGTPEEPVTCPACGKAHSMFFARDGPFILGGDAWNSFGKTFLEDGEFQRPREEALQALARCSSGGSRLSGNRPDLKLIGVAAVA